MFVTYLSSFFFCFRLHISPPHTYVCVFHTFIFFIFYLLRIQRHCTRIKQILLYKNFSQVGALVCMISIYSTVLVSNFLAPCIMEILHHHTHTHKYQDHTHTHTHTHTSTRTIHICTHTHTHTQVRTRPHTHTHTHTDNTHIHAHTSTRTIHTHTHTHTHTHKYQDTHTHTHTSTRNSPLCAAFISALSPC